MTWPDYRGNLDWLKDRTILLVRSGSHAYGTNIATSDQDYKGVCIPPREYFHGYLSHFEQADSHDPDLCIYDIRKFFKLAADCNPSIIEMLWTDGPGDVIQKTHHGKTLMDGRDLFLSQKARYTFSGYAIAQLKRIKTHKEWLMNPQAMPKREDYGLQGIAMNPSEYGAALSLHDTMGEDFGLLPKKLVTLFVREREYRAAKLKYEQYQLWLKTRNVARAELEAKSGYDTKHGMHLVRLMRMCKEILTTGKVCVKRDDAEELIAIRNGAWSYDKLIEWADKMDGEMDSWMKDSKLPHSPDRVKLDHLCVELVESIL